MQPGPKPIKKQSLLAGARLVAGGHWRVRQTPEHSKIVRPGWKRARLPSSCRRAPDWAGGVKLVRSLDTSRGRKAVIRAERGIIVKKKIHMLEQGGLIRAISFFV